MDELKFLTGEEILEVKDREIVPLYIPEWGGYVRLLPPSATERDAWETGLVEKRGRGTVFKQKHVRASLAALCLVNEKGQRIYTEAQIPALGRKGAKALQRIFEACQKIMGVSDEEIAELEGNSAGADGGV